MTTILHCCTHPAHTHTHTHTHPSTHAPLINMMHLINFPLAFTCALKTYRDDLKQASSASGSPLCLFHFIMFKCPSQHTFVLLNDTLKQSSQYIIPLYWPRIARSIWSNRISAITHCAVIDEMSLDLSADWITINVNMSLNT